MHVQCRHPFACDGVVIRNTTIYSPVTRGNTDGQRATTLPSTHFGVVSLTRRYYGSCFAPFLHGMNVSTSLKQCPLLVLPYCYPIHADVRYVDGVNKQMALRCSSGLDPDFCINVLVEDCTITSGDDAIAVKAGSGFAGGNADYAHAFEKRIGHGSENMIFRRTCVVKAALYLTGA